MEIIKGFRRKKHASPEKAIENSILSFLKAHGIFCFKVDTVGIFDPTKKIYRKKNSIHHIKGVSDILGIYKGRMLAVEVKSAKGRLTEEQQDFLNKVNEEGGFGLMARSIDDVDQMLKLTKGTT